MLDYASTRYLRDEGNDEWLLSNSIADNRPIFVGIELAGTAASIGVSYLFHRTGHHSLERWISIGHIGVGVGGSVHNYLLKPPQIITQPMETGSAILAGRWAGGGRWDAHVTQAGFEGRLFSPWRLGLQYRIPISGSVIVWTLGRIERLDRHFV